MLGRRIQNPLNVATYTLAARSGSLPAITVISFAFCAFIALVFPAISYQLEHAGLESDLRLEALMRARAVDAMILREPEFWLFMQNELLVVLDDKLAHTAPFSARIVTTDGASSVVVAERALALESPSITLSEPIYDTGRQVGKVEIVASLRPLLLHTAGVAAMALLFALALYWAAISLPLAALRRAIRDLHEETLLAEQANQAKSAFLAGMSHELRTPMNGVIGMTSLLLDTKLSVDQREYIETIRVSGTSLLSIINEVLDFSKIESGKMQLEMQPFELARCIEDVFSMIAPSAQAKGLDLLYLVENDVPAWIDGDVTRLRQVLVNLVNNGVKFTEHGEIYVRVAKVSCDADHLELAFSIRDTGIGIAAQKQAELFQPFYQVDASTARKYGGTGLGLAITSRLVKLMGGSVRVSSELGQGATFNFSVRTRPVPAMAVRYSQSDQFAVQGKRLLLVDDNETALNILSTVVRRWGLECQVAGSPAAALEILRMGASFDAAIFDYHMPGMDGVQLARETRRVAGCEALPLILFSSSDPAHETAGGAGLFAVRITKPLRQSMLFEALIEALVGGRRVQSVKPHNAASTQEQRLRRSQVRLLVAEDNSINLRLIMLMLQKSGYRADVAANGVEVLQALQRQHYDIILMDVQMPEMDGMEATRRIRAAHNVAQPYIVAVTANVLDDNRRQYLDTGMDAFLAKPYMPDELDAVLLQAMEKMTPPQPSPMPFAQSSRDPLDGTAQSRAIELLNTVQARAIVELMQGGEEDAMGTMIDSMQADVGKFASMVEMNDAMENIVRAAHSIKGAAQNLGASALGGMYAEFEQLAKQGDLATIRLKLEQGKLLTVQSVQALKNITKT